MPIYKQRKRKLIPILNYLKMYKELCITSDPNRFFYLLAAEKWKKSHTVKYYNYTEFIITTQARKDMIVKQILSTCESVI